jgi:transposase InsO family protein
LSDLRSDESVQRYERDNPGELLHIDSKKLGPFDKVGHRITGDRIHPARNVGWDFVFVAVNDHNRLAFTQVHPDETKLSAEEFVRAAVGYFASMGVPVQRVSTDNGMSLRSGLFAETCLELDIAEKFTRAYRPQTNGKTSASSSPPSASGPTATPMRTQTSAEKPRIFGIRSTTAIDRTTASTSQRQSRVSRCLERIF